MTFMSKDQRQQTSIPLWRKRLLLIGLIFLGATMVVLLQIASVAGVWRVAGLDGAGWELSVREYRDWRVGCRFYVEVSADEPPEWLRFQEYMNVYEGDSQRGLGLYSSGPDSSYFRLLVHLRAYEALGYCQR